MVIEIFNNKKRIYPINEFQYRKTCLAPQALKPKSSKNSTKSLSGIVRPVKMAKKKGPRKTESLNNPRGRGLERGF